MSSTEYSFKTLSEEQLKENHPCQRAFCSGVSNWSATIPVKRYNGFSRNIFLCARHKIKLEKKISRVPRIVESQSLELETEVW